VAAGADVRAAQRRMGNAMEMTMRANHWNSCIRAREWGWLLLVLLVTVLAATGARAAAPAQKAFASPDDAASALVQAVKAHDWSAILAVLGNSADWKDAKVYLADLGPNTAAQARKMQRFDPGKGWSAVKAP
jgi:hypothetical protein